MRRRYLTALVLLAATMVAALLLILGVGVPGSAVERDGEHAKRDERLRGEDPRLRGMPGARAESEAELVPSEAGPMAGAVTGSDLAGVVVDQDGRGIEGATVFLREKLNALALGGSSTDAPGIPTQEGGRWELRGRVPTGLWIGALMPGYLPGHADGDAIQDPENIRIVLERGPEVVVRVASFDGGPMELDTTIFVRPEEDGEARPRPGQDWAFEQRATIEAGAGEVRLAVGTRTSVVVTARYRHTYWIVDPERRVVTPPERHATFTIARSCRLGIEVLDAATGEPLPRGFLYQIFRADGDALSGGSMSIAGGRMDVPWGIPPGRYTLRVWATGYVPRVSDDFVLHHPGEHAEVKLALDPDPTIGNIRVTVPILTDLPRIETFGGDSMAAPAFFLWKRSPAQWGCLDGETQRETDTDYVFAGVPEGQVDVLVGSREHGLSTWVGPIRIHAGRTTTVTADLVSGVIIDLRTVLRPSEEYASFRVRHPLYGELPSYGHEGKTSYYFDPGSLPPREAKLGPYPGPRIEIELTTKQGTTRTVVIE